MSTCPKEANDDREDVRVQPEVEKRLSIYLAAGALAYLVVYLVFFHHGGGGPASDIDG